MQKYKSSRSGKTSQKFEPASLSQKSLNNIDESWKVIGNLKSGMRDLEDKLNKYSDNIKLLSSISNSSFNTTAHSINMSTEPTNKIFTSTSFNSALRPSGYNKSPSKYTIAEKPILENSYFSSTIQACDPGLGYFNPYQSDYENYSKYECDEPYEYSPDVKCLNDFSTDLNGSFLNFRSNVCQDLIKSPKTTRVDVYVPSDKNYKNWADPKSKNSPMIPKEKLTRKTTSGKMNPNKCQQTYKSKNLDPKRSTSEYDVKYEFCQAGTSASFHQQRTLHKETDLLPGTSTKRHLSSASFSNAIEPRYHDFVKPASRKIAFPKHEHAEADELLKGHSKLNVKEEADRLLGLSCAGKRQKKPDEPKSSAIITTSSWRIGENLAQKHIKSEPDKNMPTHPYQVQYNPRSTSAPVNQSPQAAKKTKRTECHLVQTQASVTPKSAAKASVSSPQANKAKPKPYDLNDIQKYIQSQKSKRLHETKSEKEKQKVQDEERKKKLQELYRKQRLQAIKSAQINSTSKLNNSNEKANCSNNSSKLYDQDMSKILMERISHLLNDNDKLVEKQRKQILSEKHKTRKKVDFGGTEDAEMDNDMEQNESSTSSASLSTASSSVTPKQSNPKTASLKHDRLKKICSMALDLQTKLQQTKLKLFGFNPTDDEDMIDYYKKNDNTFVTSTKNGHEENQFVDELDAIQFDRVFKQDVRDNRNYVHEELEASGEDVSRPGVGSLRSYRLVLTPDLAARRIQHAFRLYRARRKAQRAPKRLKKENVRPPPPPPPPPLKSEQVMGLNSQKDGYSFLSVYKKKSGFGAPVSSSVAPLHQTTAKTKQESNNYTDDFMTFNETKVGEADRLSTIKSSLSSSSDSTSLSKYITNSKNSKHLKLSKSAEIQPVPDDSYDSTSATSSSNSSNSTVTSSHLKTAPSTSRQKSIRSEQPSQLPQPQKPKTRIVQESESKDPKRYSPASLERLLHAGINYLDTLNTSALQLEELDKIKCIGFAQQDTVALAQYLKDKQTVKQDSGPKGDKFPKSRSSSLTSNSSSSSSASTTVSTSSYNETEADSKNTKSSTKKYSENPKPKHKPSFAEPKDLDQDISIINTVSELNDTKTDTRIKTELDDEEIEMEKSFRQVLPSEMHIKKTRQEYKDLKDQSQYDLSQSSISQYESHPSMRLSFDEDSFKKFTGEIVKKYMHEEELRSKHQADLLKLREKALVEKTKSELAWLEQMKKKAQDKGEDEKMPLILRKEKGIIQKLKQEQDNINKMKEVQRKVAESRLKLLSQHSEVVKWCQKKLKRHSLNQSYKGNENENDETSSASNAASTTSSVESVPTPALSSSSINQEPDQLDDLSFNLNNQSLVESKIMKQYQFNTEKYLTEREKKLRQRRKHAEELLAWKKKLDDEELRVREIEKQANQVLKKKSKQSPTKNEKKTKSEDQEADLDQGEEDVTTDVVKTESKLAPVSTKSIATSINENSYAESFDSSTISTVHEIKSKNLTKKSRDDSQSNLVATSILNSIPTQLNNSGSKSDTRDDDTTRDSSSSSLSEMTGPTPSSSTSSSVRELEQKVKELKNEYLKKKNEAEKLGKILKETEKIKIKEKEEQLRKKIESYDQKLEKIKSALNQKDKKKSEEINEETAYLSSTSDDAKSSSTSTKPAGNAHGYEDDFESEKASNHASEKKIEDDQKSTVSEISEDLMENGASQSDMKLDGLEDGEENSASLNSSTDTQILILGSSRQAKEREQSEREIEKFRQQDMAIQAFLKSCLDQVIDQMIEVKNSKNSKLIAEQYRETMEELDEEGSVEETSDDEHISDDLMSTVKIPIPPIDLDEDFEEDGKQKKVNDCLDESAKPVVFNVPFEREKVSLLVDQVIHNYYWKHLANLQILLETNSANEASNMYDEKSLEDFFKPEAEFKESELSFKKMILDLTGELMYDLYLERFEQADVVSEYLPGHLRPLKKKHFKSYLRGPSDLSKVKELVGRKVLDLFKLSPEKENRDKVRSKWRVQKKLDLVDGLLDVEMREQEHEWSNYEIEEYEAKLLISNSVFDLVLKDTIDCVQSTIIKKNSM